MSLTPSKVTWDPNRYKAHEYVINYDSNGNPTLSKKEASYTGVNYNFSSLPSGTSTTSQTQTGTTAQSGTTTQQQTSEAFGNVKPHYWTDDKPDDKSINYTTKSSWTESPFDPDKFNIDKEHQQKMEILGIEKQLAAGGLDYEEEQALREQLNKLGSYDKTTGKYILKEKEPTGLLAKFPTPLQMAAKGVGGFLDAITPERSAVQKLNSRLFTTRGDLGSNVDSHRIVGDPTKELFAGMNHPSARGNLEKKGQKRLDIRNNTISRRGVNDYEYATKHGLKYDKKGVSVDFHKNTENMEKEHSTYTKEKRKEINKHKDTIDMPHMLTSGKEDQSGPDSGKSIICTQMYQQTQLEDWKRTMQLWYIFQKKYLTIEHQQGYHFLFKPFVTGMKKSKVLTALGKHCAIARTNDIKHIMFGTPFSLSGRLVRLVTEPICYITGKIKSWL